MQKIWMESYEWASTVKSTCRPNRTESVMWSRGAGASIVWMSGEAESIGWSRGSAESIGWRQESAESTILWMRAAGKSQRGVRMRNPCQPITRDLFAQNSHHFTQKTSFFNWLTGERLLIIISVIINPGVLKCYLSSLWKRYSGLFW